MWFNWAIDYKIVGVLHLYYSLWCVKTLTVVGLTFYFEWLPFHNNKEVTLWFIPYKSLLAVCFGVVLFWIILFSLGSNVLPWRFDITFNFFLNISIFLIWFFIAFIFSSGLYLMLVIAIFDPSVITVLTAGCLVIPIFSYLISNFTLTGVIFLLSGLGGCVYDERYYQAFMDGTYSYPKPSILRHFDFWGFTLSFLCTVYFCGDFLPGKQPWTSMISYNTDKFIRLKEVLKISFILILILSLVSIIIWSGFEVSNMKVVSNGILLSPTGLLFF